MQTAITVTSDMREKTDVSKLLDDEKLLDAWSEVDWYKYKLIDHVDKYGDSAEYQLGVMAQEILSILETHGIDAAKYGIVTYNSWSEYSYEDVDGAIVTLPAGDLYTVNYNAANSLEAALQRRKYERLLKRVESLEGRS